MITVPWAAVLVAAGDWGSGAVRAAGRLLDRFRVTAGARPGSLADSPAVAVVADSPAVAVVVDRAVADQAVVEAVCQPARARRPGRLQLACTVRPGPLRRRLAAESTARSQW